MFVARLLLICTEEEDGCDEDNDDGEDDVATIYISVAYGCPSCHGAGCVNELLHR